MYGINSGTIFYTKSGLCQKSFVIYLNIPTMFQNCPTDYPHYTGTKPHFASGYCKTNCTDDVQSNVHAFKHKKTITDILHTNRATTYTLYYYNHI